MRKKITIATASFIILSNTFFPVVTHAFTPDSEGNFIPPSVIKSKLEVLAAVKTLPPVIQASFDTNRLIEESKKYIGIKYQVAGKTPKGFDCSGFVGYIFKKSVGITLPGSASTIFERGTEIEKNELQAGDLVYFKTSSKTISHVGIYIGNGKFIHSQSSIGITITSLSEHYFATRYQGAKRI
jgi:cell wall-associated NlpC family hydrolase